MIRNGTEKFTQSRTKREKKEHTDQCRSQTKWTTTAKFYSGKQLATKKSFKRRSPGRQQSCWGSLFCTNLTQPTGNLDSVTAGEIINILKTLAKDRNKCVIVVTHSKEVSDSADIILELSGKKLKKVNKMNLEVE